MLMTSVRARQNGHPNQPTSGDLAEQALAVKAVGTRQNGHPSGDPVERAP